MATLAERLAELANPAPVLEDPENDANFETAARVVDNFEEDEATPSAVEISSLRKKVVPLLSDVDARYAGRKVTRKSLLDRESSESGGSDVETSDSEDLDDGIEEFRSKLQGEIPPNSSDEDIIVEEEGIESMHESDDDSNDDDSDEEESQNDESEDDSEEASLQGKEDVVQKFSNFDLNEEIEKGKAVRAQLEASLQGKEDVVQKFSNFDLNEEIEKGKAVRAQLALWDSLLECRIKMQKILIAANKLPQFDTWEEFSHVGQQGYCDNLKTSERVVKGLLDNLMDTQQTLLQNHPETKLLLGDKSGKRSAPEPASGEEITSNSEQDEPMPEEKKVGKKPRAKKRKYGNHEYPDILGKMHQEFINYRNATIQKWNEKTRLATGKLNHKSFHAFEQSALKQIEQILSDKDRLRRRTQLKRTIYRVFGKHEEEEIEVSSQHEKPETDHELPIPVSKQVDNTKEYDTEIFDDDDFYHQLLRELIERKTADVNDPVALSRQWLEIQRLRSKMKRKVDTKASKGRKIRFDVHPKLINFMAPVSFCLTTDEAKNELFGSLFGKRSHK